MPLSTSGKTVINGQSRVSSISIIRKWPGSDQTQKRMANGNLFKTFVHDFNYIRNNDASACATTAEQIFALMEFNVSFSVFGLHNIYEST